MTMITELLYPVPDRPGEYYPTTLKAEWPDLGGYQSVDAAVKEIGHRFSHRNPRPYRNGLEMDGYAGAIHRTWFEATH